VPGKNLLLVFSGLIVERLIYLIPVANLSVLAVFLPLIQASEFVDTVW